MVLPCFSRSGSAFFICIGDQPSLDFGGMRNPDGQGFAAFGRVVEGMDGQDVTLSGIADRIDIRVAVPAVPYRELSGTARGMDTATIRQRVASSRAIQRERRPNKA